MKKIKIIPSLLLVILCFGLLSVGVWSVTSAPISNTITGTIIVEEKPEESTE